jgi:ParB-like chromosome segregation protein Spo0J
MPTTHRYQVMPDLSPEEYETLKADIAAHGVLMPIEVDGEGNIIDGFHRKKICDELGIECPEQKRAGLNDAEKLERAFQVNVARRHLSGAQKRQLAARLWDDKWTQERIAQVLCVAQSTHENPTPHPPFDCGSDHP